MHWFHKKALLRHKLHRVATPNLSHFLIMFVFTPSKVEWQPVNTILFSHVLCVWDVSESNCFVLCICHKKWLIQKFDAITHNGPDVELIFLSGLMCKKNWSIKLHRGQASSNLVIKIADQIDFFIFLLLEVRTKVTSNTGWRKFNCTLLGVANSNFFSIL